MALIVEDGTGINGAESLASVAQADLYHSNRMNTAWADLETPSKEAYLRLATDYMQQAYRTRWKGYRSQLYQSLDWPRKSVIITDMAINYMVPFASIPTEIVAACCEYALRAINGALAADLTQGVVSESVGAISVTYDTRTPQGNRYRAIDMLLRPYLLSSGAMFNVGRA